MHYKLTPHQRKQVDALKGDHSTYIITIGGRASGKTFLTAVAVSEKAKELNGLWLRDARTEQDYWVPPGTPWQEALPVKEPA